MPLDLSRCRLTPFAHQAEAIQLLLDNEFFMLGLEMGMGKTMTTIVAAQLLFERGVIERVVVVAPASVRDVWYDEELGELAKHLFVPSQIQLYHARSREWRFRDGSGPLMSWIVTNYEFLRSRSRLDDIQPFATERTLLVLDESSAIKSYNAVQTKACFALRKECGRVVLLNGTPIANNPIDMFSQGNMMHPKILQCKGVTHFRARYAEMGGFVVHTPWGSRPTQIVGWKNLEDLQKRFAPYILRRLKKDCLDLPPVLPSVTIFPTLDKPTWKIYKEMRDEMVAWLSDATVSVAAQTITKVMRLSQITSGFLGGLEQEIYAEPTEERPDWLLELDKVETPPSHVFAGKVQTIGREKLDALLEQIDRFLEEDPNLKLLVWSRFVPELARLLDEWKTRYPHVLLGCIAGKPLLGTGLSKREERSDALRLLDPRTAPAGPVFVGGTYGTGSLGLNLTACHTMVNLSFDYSYFKFVQSAARVDRPGQVHPVSTFDVVAVGPQGQKTIDHAIVRARREKEDVATWTTAAWIRALGDD